MDRNDVSSPTLFRYPYQDMFYNITHDKVVKAIVQTMNNGYQEINIEDT